MDDNLVLIVLVVVTFATALNLVLTFRLSALVREAAAPPLSIPIGETVPPFEGRLPPDGHRIRSSELVGRALVLVFLSPGCPTCRGRISELLQILPGASSAGVAMWIVPADDVHDISSLVGETPLVDHVLTLDAATRRLLNPRSAAPLYLFIDDRMIARASSYLGDEDWRTFVRQMREAVAREVEAR